MSQKDPHSAPHHGHEVEQEVETIHVPRGKSRARYVMTIILLIFILVIFVVSDLFQSAFTRGGADEGGPFMQWNHPVHGERSVGYRDFVMERRRTEDFYRVLGVDRRQLRELTNDENLARTMILDELALEAGVEFTDKELRTLIRERFGDAATFQAMLDAAGVAAIDFQESLRRLMRAQRYESMLTGLMAQPDPSLIEKSWKEQHKEYALEVAVFAANVDDPQIAFNLPDQAGLQQWYDELDVNRKRAMFGAEWKPERAAAELAYFNFESGDGAALQARYPRPEGTDVEQLANDYHSQFAHLRFRRPEEKADETDARARLYFTLEEIADRARSEALTHAAMKDWAADVRARTLAGETVDLAGEAVALGVSFVREATPKSQLEWSSMPVLGSSSLADNVMRAARGDRLVTLLLTETAIAFGRVTERLDAGAPAFDEVADKALLEWRKQKAQDIARERAGQLVEACKPPKVDNVQPQPMADGESFALKAGEVGVAVEATGWFDQADLPTVVGEDESGVRHFMRELRLGARSALNTVPDAVMGPYTSADKMRVFVARLIGSRDPEQLDIEPREYRGLVSNAMRARQQEFSEQFLGKAGLERNFGLRFPGRTAPEVPENVEQPDAPASNG